jgi:hypothetical protein
VAKARKARERADSIAQERNVAAMDHRTMGIETILIVFGVIVVLAIVAAAARRRR